MQNFVMQVMHRFNDMLTAGQYGAFAIMLCALYFIYREVKAAARIAASIVALLAMIHFVSPTFYAETLRALQTGLHTLCQTATGLTGGR